MNSNNYGQLAIEDQNISVPISYFDNELDQDQYLDALNQIDKLIKLKPSSDAYALRGRIHMLSSKYEKAIEDYEHSINLNGKLDSYQEFIGDQDSVHFDRAIAFFKLNRPEDALNVYCEYAQENLNNHEKYDKVSQICLLGGGLAISLKEYDLAKAFYDIAFSISSIGDIKNHKEIYIKLVDDNNKKDKLLNDSKEEAEKTNKKLEEKDRELEDMMAMFAHKFRSPLDAIIYNTTHDNQPALYTEAAQTMRGLLDVFSIISTDESVLKARLKQDKQGVGDLMTVLGATLDMIMLHLLSVSGSEKIQQHYMAYAKAQGLCAADVSYKSWDEDFFELERKLQGEWQKAYAQLLNESADLDTRLRWLEQHFFKLELTGFDHANIHFKEYGITASFLTILLNEILVNAFKYYSSLEKQPVTLEWVERDCYQVLSCRNPSVQDERTMIKGSRKGHTFLSALARKTGCQFNKPTPSDNFVIVFGIPNELLLSK